MPFATLLSISGILLCIIEYLLNLCIQHDEVIGEFVELGPSFNIETIELVIGLVEKPRFTIHHRVYAAFGSLHIRLDFRNLRLLCISEVNLPLVELPLPGLKLFDLVLMRLLV